MVCSWRNSLDPNGHMWLMLAEDGRKIRRSPTEHKPLDPGQARPRIAITRNTEARSPTSEASAPFSKSGGWCLTFLAAPSGLILSPSQPYLASHPMILPKTTVMCLLHPPHLVRDESVADGILIGRRPQDEWVNLLLSLPLPKSSPEVHLAPSASQPHLTQLAQS